MATQKQKAQEGEQEEAKAIAGLDATAPMILPNDEAIVAEGSK